MFIPNKKIGFALKGAPQTTFDISGVNIGDNLLVTLFKQRSMEKNGDPPVG